MSNTLPDPQTRNETFLNAIANGTTSGLPTPMTRSEQYLDYIAKNGGGGGGASSADNVSYDNTTSGLTAENVQDAIDEIAQSGGGMTYDVTISGTVSDYPTATDYQGATYSTTKTMSELLTKFNATGRLDIDGTLNLSGQLGTTTRYGAKVPFGDYVPYAVLAAAISADPPLVTLAHTPDSGVDALLLKVCDPLNNTSIPSWSIVVYQSGNTVYFETVNL